MATGMAFGAGSEIAHQAIRGVMGGGCKFKFFQYLQLIQITNKFNNNNLLSNKTTIKFVNKRWTLFQMYNFNF